MSELVKLDLTGQMATITINRPDKRNSLTPEMLKLLENAVIEIETMEGVNSVIITGVGDKAFCTGADLSAFSSLNFDEVRKNWVPTGHRIFKRLSQLPQITIAYLNGDVFGGGLELALACDFRVAQHEISLGFPEGKIGTIPGWAGTSRAADLIGLNRAKYMILSGATIDAKTALQWGLINHVGSLEDFLKPFSQVSPIAQQISKQLMSTFENHNNAEVLEAFAGALSSVTEDFNEGIAAFKEKRPSQFRGK